MKVRLHKLSAIAIVDILLAELNGDPSAFQNISFTAKPDLSTCY